MGGNHCKNCGKLLTDKFCSRCGQSADTRRITIRNFITHDLLHGTFHIEKGMLFTARQALLRPGQAALDYIGGKRKPFYNVFLLTLITIALLLFFRHYYDEIASDPNEVIKPKEFANEASRRIDEIFAQKSKIIIFLFVPLMALNSLILFNRRRLNYSEHSIISGMVLLGMLLISLAGHILFYGTLVVPFAEAYGNIISWVTFCLIIFQLLYGYWNAFRPDYTIAGMVLKIILMVLFLLVEMTLLFMIVFGIVSDWQFGDITFSPFG